MDTHTHFPFCGDVCALSVDTHTRMHTAGSSAHTATIIGQVHEFLTVKCQNVLGETNFNSHNCEKSSHRSPDSPHSEVPGGGKQPMKRAQSQGTLVPQATPHGRACVLSVSASGAAGPAGVCREDSSASAQQDTAKETTHADQVTPGDRGSTRCWCLQAPLSSV